MPRPTRVLWVTNNATPYRRPVWQHLGTLLDLSLVILQSDRSLDRVARRGADWRSADPELPVIPVRTLTVTVGSEPRSLLLPGRRVGVGSYDAVLLGGWDSPAYWQLLLVAVLRRRRTVGFYESTEATNRFRGGPVAAARRFFFRRLDAVVVPGPAAAAAVRGMGVSAAAIVTGFNAVDVRHFHEAAEQERRRNPVVATGHHYLCVGQLIERKNLDSVLRAFASVHRPGDLLTLVGTGPDEAALRATAEQLGITGQVRLEGHVDNASLPAVLARHHTLVLASHEEVWGLVVNEALAAGLHVVVARSAGVHASVQDMPGVHGCEPDPASVAAAMAASRADWRGWIEQPPILEHTPEAFAETFRAALTGRP